MKHFEKMSREDGGGSFVDGIFFVLFVYRFLVPIYFFTFFSGVHLFLILCLYVAAARTGSVC
jgi:hypothetical protein